MELSSDDGFTGLTQSSFSQESLNFFNFEDLFGLEESLIASESPVAAELDIISEPRASLSLQEPLPLCERNISLVSDKKLEERKEKRIPENTKINTNWALRVWDDWAKERIIKLETFLKTND